MLLVHLVKHTTKQPLEPDKEIAILLMVIMQQQNKNAVYYFYMGEKTICIILANSKQNLAFLLCRVLTGYDTDLTFARTGPKNQVLPSRRRMHQSNIFSCLPGTVESIT